MRSPRRVLAAGDVGLGALFAGLWAAALRAGVRLERGDRGRRSRVSLLLSLPADRTRGGEVEAL